MATFNNRLSMAGVTWHDSVYGRLEFRRSSLHAVSSFTSQRMKSDRLAGTFHGASEFRLRVQQIA